MSKKNSIGRAAKGIANDVHDSKKARLNNLRNIEKTSKKKSKKSAADIKKEKELKAIFIANYSEKKKFAYTTVKAFENILYSIEGIRIIVRASTNAVIPVYPYKKRCRGDTTVEHFINNRLNKVTDSRYEFYLPYNYSNETTIAELRKEEESKNKAN